MDGALHNKSSEVFIKTRPSPASLPSKGQVTEQTNVKWSITSRHSRTVSSKNKRLCSSSLNGLSTIAVFTIKSALTADFASNALRFP